MSFDATTTMAVAPASDRPAPSWIGEELGVIGALARRDLLRLMRERTRWLGLVAQPLMLLAILGAGFSESLVVAGTTGNSMQYLYPGILGMVLLFTSIFSTMSVIEDRESGFLQGVLVAPGSPAALVLGKTAGVTIIILVQTALFLLAAPLADTPWDGIAWPTLLAVVLLSNVGLTCANFVFAWLLRSTQAYHALMSVVLMPLWIVSGAMFPAPSGWMGALVAVNPMTYGVSGLRHALGTATPTEPGLWVCLAVLGGVSIVSLIAAVAVTRRR